MKNYCKNNGNLFLKENENFFKEYFRRHLINYMYNILLDRCNDEEPSRTRLGSDDVLIEEIEEMGDMEDIEDLDFEEEEEETSQSDNENISCGLIITEAEL